MTHLLRWRRSALLLPLALLALVGWAGLHPAAAQAHAEVDRATPTSGAVLTTPPARIDIWFTEHLTPGVSTIQVYDGQRRRVDKGDSAVDPKDTRRMGVDLPPLPSGLYTVVWANVSADDGHPNRGGFAFTVLLPTPTAAAVSVGAPAGVGTAAATPTPPPTPLPLPSQSQQAVADLLNPATDRPTAAVDLVSGWLTFSALVLVGGGALFALLALLPALASAKADSAALATRLQRRFFLLTVACGIIGAVGALVSLLAKAEIATGLPPSDLLSGAVLAPLLQAWSGMVWLLREAAFALMAVAAVVGIVLLRPRAGAASAPPAPAHPFGSRAAGAGQQAVLVILALLGDAGLLFQALDSHLAAGHVARQGPFATATLSLHLLAVAVWVGGLGYAALLLWPIWRRLPEEIRAAIAAEGVARFSPLALACVVLIVITGTYAAILLLPTPGDLLTSAYGQALDVKIALLLVLILLGAANQRTLAQVALLSGGAPTALQAWLLRRARALPNARGVAAAVGAAGRRLVRAMRLEFAIAAVVLLAAGTMLEVGPPGVALAADAVKLDDMATLAALPATPTPLPPTPTAPPRAAAPAVYSASASVADLRLRFTVDPAVAGATSAMQVEVQGNGGAPTTGAEVKLFLTAQGLDLGTQALTTKPASPGRYTIAAPAFAAPGPWQVMLVVRRDNVPEVDHTFTVPIAAPAVAAATPTPAPAVAPAALPPTMLHASLAFQSDPPAVGAANATLRLSDGAGQPVAGVQPQALWLMPEHAHLAQTTFQATGAPGVYASTVDLSMAGAWLANMTLALPDGRTAKVQFTFNVRDRGLFGT